MTRMEYQFVRGIRASREVQYELLGKQGQILLNTLPLTQSIMDSACGLISTLQAAMLLLGIPRLHIERLSAARAGPLKQLWEVAKEDYFLGANARDISKYVQVFEPELECTQITGSAKRIGKSITDVIVRDSAVPLLYLESRQWIHWTTCIGVELDCDTKEPRSLLCLDPSVAPPWAVPFSARLELSTRPTKSEKGAIEFPLIYRSNEGNRSLVKLLSAVVIRSTQFD